MAKTRVWSAGAAVLGVLLLIASWFLLISPQRSEASSLRDQVTQQETFNDQVKLKTQQLKAQFASLPARQAQLAEIRQQMPDNPALPSLVRDLSKYAEAAGVTLMSVAPTAPTPLLPAGASTVATADSAPVQQIQTTIVSSGSYAELTLYLQKLQSQMRRVVLVDNIQLTKGDTQASTGSGSSDVLQMTLTGKVFVLNTAAASQAGAAVQSPATTPAAPSTGTAN